MAKNQNRDDDASSSRMRSESCAPWSDLDHDVLVLVMMLLGFVDYYSFRGVCKSWRLLADSNKNKFMASRPPMSITISTDSNEKACYLEDFEGRKFKKVFPDFAVGGECVGLTFGYLIFFTKETRDFWLVNPITRKQLHFPNSPINYHSSSINRAILVFSPSTSRWVFVVLCGGKIWVSIEGKGPWKHVPYSVLIYDMNAFKGKIYILTYDIDNPLSNKHGVCELGLKPEPKFTLLEIRNPLASGYFYPNMFMRSGENRYVIWTEDYSNSLRELDISEMKWIKPCEKTMEEYAFFLSLSNYVAVAVRRESWADGRIASYPNTDIYRDIRFNTAKMWYFPHECMNVDHIDE